MARTMQIEKIIRSMTAPRSFVDARTIVLQMVFSLLWNLTGSDPYEVNELGQVRQIVCIRNDR
eukprot:751541-Hanusia_phi.AAC.2